MPPSPATSLWPTAPLTLEVIGIGFIELVVPSTAGPRHVVLKDALYVPSLPANLLSAKKLHSCLAHHRHVHPTRTPSPGSRHAPSLTVPSHTLLRQTGSLLPRDLLAENFSPWKTSAHERFGPAGDSVVYPTIPDVQRPAAPHPRPSRSPSPRKRVHDHLVEHLIHFRTAQSRRSSRTLSQPSTSRPTR